MSNLEREFAGCSRDVFHKNHEGEEDEKGLNQSRYPMLSFPLSC